MRKYEIPDMEIIERNITDVLTTSMPPKLDGVEGPSINDDLDWGDIS